jgi:hypothetical protein
MSSKYLRKLQLGREVTPGTGVAATAIWRGQGTLEDKREVTFVDEQIGIVGGTDRAYVGRYLSALDMGAVPATFQQILHILEAGIKAVGTGAADGAGTDKIYNYPFPTTARNTIKTYTLEGGDDQQAEKFAYGFVEEFSLEGNAGEAWMMSAKWLGRQTTTATFTAALSAPTVEEMLFGLSKLYIDPIGSAYGTTVKALTMLAAKLKVKTGWSAGETADGSLDFSLLRFGPPEIELEVTFEHDATSVAEKAAWKALTARSIQIKIEGSAVGTPGTTYSKQTCLINLPGKWGSFAKIDEKDGNDIVSGKFTSKYDATKGDAGNILVATELTAVP